MNLVLEHGGVFFCRFFILLHVGISKDQGQFNEDSLNKLVIWVIFSTRNPELLHIVNLMHNENCFNFLCKKKSLDFHFFRFLILKIEDKMTKQGKVHRKWMYLTVTLAACKTVNKWSEMSCSVLNTSNLKTF